MAFTSKQYNPWDGVNFVPHADRKRKILFGISVSVIVLSVTLLAYPFWGSISYHLANSQQAYASNTHATWQDAIMRRNQILQRAKQAKTSVTKKAPAPIVTKAPVAPAPKVTQGNRITIPKIGVDMEIQGGRDANILFQGVAWNLPGTSNPALGGNTVIGAHRYLYKPPSEKTFYNLDKLGVGDVVSVVWEGVEYSYRVYNTKIVEPSQIEILAPTKNNKLTLFTCTPLFTSKQRLVIEAEPI